MADQSPSAGDSDRSHRVRDMGEAEKLSPQELDALGVIYPGMANQQLLNSYRDVRNALLRLSDYKNFVCLITSLSPKHETSLLTINLAAVFAFDKARSALVVDCSHAPNVIDRLLPIEETFGVIDFIELDYDDMSSMLYHCGIQRVRVIPAGRMTETRTEVLESTRMREVIIELKNRYPDRFVFINAPNMALSSEVQVLSNISDMVLFELQPGTVTTKEVSEAVEMIGAEKVAGILFSEN